jgi:hypothetical protein
MVHAAHRMRALHHGMMHGSMRGFDRHHTFTNFRRYLLFFASAVKGERDFIPFLLSADESLKLGHVHHALVSDHRDDIVSLKFGIKRRAAFCHIGDHESESLRNPDLSRELWGDSPKQQTQIRGHFFMGS